MDTGIVEGSTISMYYDPMISKVSGSILSACTTIQGSILSACTISKVSGMHYDYILSKVSGIVEGACI